MLYPVADCSLGQCAVSQWSSDAQVRKYPCCWWRSGVACGGKHTGKDPLQFLVCDFNQQVFYLVCLA